MKEKRRAETTEEWAKNIADNQINYWSSLSAECHVTILNTQFITGIPHPFLNGILRTEFTQTNAQKLVDQTISQFKWRRLPFVWWINPFSTPKNLGEYLEIAGFTYIGTFAGMVYELGKKPLALTKNNEVSIEPVRDSASLEAWRRVVTIVFGFSQMISQSYCQLFIDKGLSPNQPFRHFIAKIAGKEAGAVTLFVDETGGGIYNLSVLPEFRKQGVGAALIEEVLRQIESMHISHVISQVAPLSQRVYQDIGFAVMTNLQVYIWPGNQTQVPSSPYTRS